jgi:hypothetical protein
MSICTICNKNRQIGELRIYHTARILDVQRKRITQDAVQTTTTYGDFQEHRFAVCSKCKLIWDRIALPLAILIVIGIAVALFVLAGKMHNEWLFLAALLAIIVGAGPASHLSTDARLSKKALHERSSKITGIHAFFFTGETSECKAFDEGAYRKLIATHR